MLSAIQRRKEIYNLIKESKEVRVSDLVDRFQTSGVTIRNDLTKLEEKGLIDRGFGTVSIREEQSEEMIPERSVPHLQEKKKIGAYAVNLVKENESIMIYTGSTALQIAKNLQSFKNLIVVTNSIITAYELGKNPFIKTIMLGGYYNPDTNAVFGQHAVQQLNDYKLDKLFLSVDGIHAVDGVTSEHPYETEISRAMIKNAAEVIVTADFSKVGISRFIQIAEIGEINTLITDDKAPEQELKRIESAGVKVVVV